MIVALIISARLYGVKKETKRRSAGQKGCGKSGVSINPARIKAFATIFVKGMIWLASHG